MDHNKAELSILFWAIPQCKQCRNEWMNQCRYFCPFLYPTNTYTLSHKLTQTHTALRQSRLSPVLEFQEKCHCSELIALPAVDHWGFCEAIFCFLILWPRVCINASPAVLYSPWRRFCSSAQSSGTFLMLYDLCPHRATGPFAFLCSYLDDLYREASVIKVAKVYSKVLCLTFRCWALYCTQSLKHRTGQLFSWWLMCHIVSHIVQYCYYSPFTRHCCFYNN